MKGQGFRNLIGDNLNAVNPLLAAQQAMNGKKRMCWKCQKEKYTRDGRMILRPGLMMFVCKECEDAKAARLKEKNT